MVWVASRDCCHVGVFLVVVRDQILLVLASVERLNDLMWGLM